MFDHPAKVHDDHVVGHLGNHPEVMGDQDDGHAGLLLEVGQQLKNLRLGGHVQSGGRLVRDQQLGIAGQRHRDQRPLAQPATQLKGVLVHAVLGARDAYPAQQLDTAIAGLAVAHAAVVLNGLADLVADGVDGAERAHWLLEHVGDHAGPNRPHRPSVAAEQREIQLAFVAAQDDLAADDSSGLLDDAQNRMRGHAFAAARLADDAQRLARVDIEADPVDCLDRALVRQEVGLQIAHREQRTLNAQGCHP